MNNNLQFATFAGGCFWCTEAVFQRLEGIDKVISGYTGGNIKNSAYREICTGKTRHTEAIQIFYDDKKVTFIELLEVFFAKHDPTTLNRLGYDIGTQYRSGIFYSSGTQKKDAEEFISYLEKDNVFNNPIVSEVTKLNIFYNDEEDHQNYYDDNKEQPNWQYIINPKIKKLNTYYANKLNKQ